MYPLISEYIESIKSAKENFANLTNLRPVYDDDGNPIMSSGNFAVVFKMKDEQTGKLYAVKCFLKEQEGRAEAYRLISEVLRSIVSPYILSAEYLDKELFVDTSQSDETEYPVLLMDWVEGQTLSSFLTSTYKRYSKDNKTWSQEMEEVELFELKCLPINFLRMASWLIKQPFAHGDIKPDNIIVKPNGTCVLIDYDGMYVPSMQGMMLRYSGTPNFRHPVIKDQLLGKDIDNYAISIVAISLCAFSLKPQLINESDELCIITEKESFKLFEQDIFQDDVLMSDNLFQDLLAIYLHTLSQNIIESDYYEGCISEYLCPHNYDLFSTKAPVHDSQRFWEDEYGVRYSLDGRMVIEASKQLEGFDYVIREGVITICDQAFQGKKLKSIQLPNSVIAIGDLAFANNDDMEYCNIPSSVKYIFDNNPWGDVSILRKWIVSLFHL